MKKKDNFHGVAGHCYDSQLTSMSESVIDFGSVVPGTTVRAVKIDGIYYMPRRDIIMAVCNEDNVKASKTWTQKITDEEKNDLLPFLAKHQFSGVGNIETEVYSLDGAILLTMMCPGKFARSVRIKAANLLKKWIHDNTNDPLLKEMSSEPVAVLAKRKREDLDYEERWLALREREARLEADVAMIPVTVKERELAHHHKLVQAIQSMCPGNVLDDRTRLMLKDRGMNLLLGESARAITNGAADPDGNPKSVSDIAAAMGKAFNKKDVKAIGRLAAAKYRDRYGEDAEPPKHEQLCDGRICPVNHYVEKDHDLVEAAVREFAE